MEREAKKLAIFVTLMGVCKIFSRATNVLLLQVSLLPFTVGFTFTNVGTHANGVCNSRKVNRALYTSPRVSLRLSAQPSENKGNMGAKSRRSLLIENVTPIVTGTLLTALTGGPTVANAATAMKEATTLNPPASMTYPPISHKVFFDVRISRADGSFYVRDDLPDTPENRVFTGTITMGLFGTVAPVHVREFLKYVEVAYDPLDDNPAPSYGRSLFTRLDQSTGLLEGGTIPGLEVTTIGGGTAIRYNDRILASPLWVEKPTTNAGGDSGVAAPISHGTGKGLLTHRTLDLAPNFEITTRPNAELDSSHVVFGRLLLQKDEVNVDSNVSFLEACQDIPTYSMDRPASPNNTDRATEEIASTIFAKQREIFRGAAKTFGDTRLDKVYEGKLLRRVTVTKVGMLD